MWYTLTCGFQLLTSEDMQCLAQSSMCLCLHFHSFCVIIKKNKTMNFLLLIHGFNFSTHIWALSICCVALFRALNHIMWIGHPRMQFSILFAGQKWPVFYILSAVPSNGASLGLAIPAKCGRKWAGSSKMKVLFKAMPPLSGYLLSNRAQPATEVNS